MESASATVDVTGQTFSLENPLRLVDRGLLADPVYDSGNHKLPLLAVRFWDHDTLHRSGIVGDFFEQPVQSLQVLFCLLLEALDGYPIDTSTAVAASHILPGQIQVALAVDLIDERVNLAFFLPRP